MEMRYRLLIGALLLAFIRPAAAEEPAATSVQQSAVLAYQQMGFALQNLRDEEVAMRAGYEARIATLIEWLKEAQQKKR